MLLKSGKGEQIERRRRSFRKGPDRFDNQYGFGASDDEKRTRKQNVGGEGKGDGEEPKTEVYDPKTIVGERARIERKRTAWRRPRCAMK